MRAQLILALYAALVATTGHAQSAPERVAGATPAALRLVNGQRLSDWLLAHPTGPDYFLAGLSFRVAAEKPAQAAERSALLLYIANAPIASHTPPADREALSHWLEALPITGRIAVPVIDARWMQIHPESDPVLSPLDSIEIPVRPTRVSIVTEAGVRCEVPHLAGLYARDYLASCLGLAALDVEHAYIAQPDARVDRVSTAAWRPETQPEPGPGAWIFAPSTKSGWSDALSVRLAAFLATQGPATDALIAPSGGIVSLAEPRSLGPAPRTPQISASDWGVIGLLQTPTARMRDTSDVDVSYSRVAPYSRANFIFQPFDWLEAGFRYSALSNQLYGVEPGNTQAYIDKSVDVKIRLFSETQHLPAVAVGLRDIGGTGLFSGEYLVGSKRFGDVDVSLGLGWGNLGARGDLSNPLDIFSSSFATRENMPSSGELSLHSYFHGRTAPFGGVEWQTPWQPFSVKVEFDGNNYRHEPFNTVLPDASPINLGLVYHYSKSLDFTVGVERGNTAMFSLSLHTPLERLSVPKLADPAPVPIAVTRPPYVFAAVPAYVAPDNPPSASATEAAVVVSGREVSGAGATPAVTPIDPPRGAEVATRAGVNWAQTARDISVQTGWRVAEIRPEGHDLRVVFANADAIYWRGLIDRALAVLHRDAPANFDRFRLVFVVRGTPLTELVVFRDYWVAEHTSLQAPDQKRQAIVMMPPRTPSDDAPEYKSEEALTSGGVGLSYQQSVGGPNSILLYQLGFAVNGELHVDPHTWFAGTLNLRVLDNYSGFNYDAPSNLPRVRTDIREYLEASRLTMPDLQATHLGSLGTDGFYSLYAGYLESMFAGVGAEYLYRPEASSLAIGFDINEVKQRAFRQDFGVMPYHVTTGFMTIYWQTGWEDVLAKLSIGQYLAGDRGATLDLSRTFRNGVVLGAFATKTNVSAATFGEGSFDKGIYLTVPFDAILARTSPDVAPLRWVPLIRDGGQMLDRLYPLYDQTQLRDPAALVYGPPPKDVTGQSLAPP